jgi:hypothetical protein
VKLVHLVGFTAKKYIQLFQRMESKGGPAFVCNRKEMRYFNEKCIFIVPVQYIIKFNFAVLSLRMLAVAL